MAICSYFESCAGCTLQHMSYQSQLQKKKENLSTLLKKYSFPELKVFYGEEFSYRNRMEFIAYPNGLGLRAKEGRKIVDIDHCPISLPKINTILSEVRKGFFQVHSSALPLHRLMKGVVIRATLLGDSSLSFVLNEDHPKAAAEEKEKIVGVIKEFSATTTAKNVVVTFVPSEKDDFYSSNYLVIKGNDFLQEKLSGRIFSFSIQGFFQNNSAMAEQMLDYVRKILLKYPTNTAELLDLYSGVGIFGVTCGELFQKTIFVESFSESITFAKKNSMENRLKNFSAHTLHAHQLSRLKLSSDLYVITDPPRIGMEEKAIIQLNTLKPKVIVYVSCNPQQLSKDLAKFKRYTIKSVALFDLFPQTWHGEVVVELVRKE